MKISRTLSTITLSIYVLSFMAVLVAPLVPKHVSAAEATAVELSFGGKSESTAPHNTTSGSEAYQLTNCKATIVNQAMDDNLLYRSLGPRNPFDMDLNPGKYSGAGFASTIAGKYNWLSNTYTNFYKANLNGQVPTITFTEAPGGSKSTKDCGGDTANARFTLIPVSSTNGTNPANSNVWIGLQSWYHANASYSDRQNEWWAMRFTANSSQPDANSIQGTLEYLYNDRNDRFASKTWSNNFVVGGTTLPTSGVGVGNISSVKFLDAANIELTWSVNGTTVTETYTDSYWDDRHYFFLSKSSLASRENNLTIGVQGGNVKATPLSSASDAAANSIPFIYIGSPAANLCLKNCNTSSQLQGGVDNYVQQVSLYDYNIDGSKIGSSGTGLPGRQDLTGRTDTSRSKVWFYASANNKAATLVFTAGDGNEEQYIGTYALSDRANEYDYGDPTCNRATLRIAPGTTSGMTDGAWILRNISNKCLSSYDPAVNVKVIFDETKFTALTTASENTGTLPSSSRVGTLTCEVVMTNPLTWFMCPIIYAATSAADQLDSSINNMLSINTDDYLGGDNGARLREVMNNLRIIAFAIIVVAALIMVVAQASGIEVIDAYTTRKVVPGIVFAAIMIALWPALGKEIIRLGDVLGWGIRQLIYAPFGDVVKDGVQGIHFTQGASSVMALLGSGVLVALGVFATFTFAITALISVAVAFSILLLRLVIIIGLYTTAPVFIACYPLPGTRKVYSFFISTFIGANLIFFVLAGTIAIARVFAWMMYSIGKDNVIFVLGAFFIYFGVYLFLGKIISVANRTFATITGAASGLTRGLTGALQNYRGNTLKRRGTQMKQGNLYEGSKWIPGSRNLATAFNRTTMGVGTGLKGRFGLGFNARGRAAVAQTRSNAALDLKRSADYQKIAENDYALQAATYTDSASAFTGLQRDWGLSSTEARQAVADVQASVGFGASQQLAAATSLADTGTGYKNVRQAAQTMARVARGNAGSLAFTAGYVNSKAKEKGNWHLAPGYGDLNEVSTDLMKGEAVSQARYDALTLQGLSTGADPGTIVRSGRQILFDEFGLVHDRLAEASTNTAFASEYGANSAEIANMSQKVASRSEEFKAVNYGAVSTRNAAITFGVNAARQAAIAPQREALIQSGELRVYPYGGVPPGGPAGGYTPPIPPPAPPAGTAPGGPTRPARGASRGPRTRGSFRRSRQP